MADGRKNNSPVKKIPKGSTPNPKGSPDKVRVIKSKLRSTADSLREAEPVALKNVEDSVNGKSVESETLSSSKWLISSLITLEKAILQEEMARTKLRIEMMDLREDKDAQSPEDIAKEMRPRLSLVYTPENDDE